MTEVFRTSASCRRLVFWGILLCAFILMKPASAQITTARLEGIVKDQTDAVVPGSTVVATQAGTNITFEAITNDIGLYVFPRLTPGVYSVTAELTGFKRAQYQGIHLQVGDTATLNIKLETGEISETVMVDGQVATVDTVSTSVGSVVSTTQLETLPLVSRDPLALFYLQPGTNRSTGGGTADGTRALASHVTVEGAVATEPGLGQGAATSAVALPLESVGEYRVVTSSASAEYGRGAGAQVQVIYKSGTNQFHGSAFEFHRNRALNANSFFNNRQGLDRPTFIRNQFGGSVGGPILKDKAFFHFTFEGTRQKTASTQNALVLTPTAKAGTFRYYTKGANSGTMVDPKTGAPTVPASDIATINLLTVDSTRLGKDPSGLFDKLVGVFPAPNNYDIGDGFNLAGYRYLSTSPAITDQWVLKGDYVLTSKHHVSLTWSRSQGRTYGTYLLNEYRTQVGRPTNPSGFFTLTSTLTPRLLNEFRVGGVKQDTRTDNGDPDRYKPEGVVWFSGLSTGAPDSRGHPKNIYTPQYFRHVPISIADSVSWIRGNHSFKVGVDIAVNRINVSFGGDYYLPVIETSTTYNPANIPALAGLNTADRSRAQQLTNDLTGTLGRIRQEYNANSKTAFTPFDTRYRLWRSREYSYFFQDTWKMRPNLTLNLGLRYELNPPHFEAKGLYAYPVGGAAAIYGMSGPSGETRMEMAEDQGRKTYKTDRNNFGPNVGFNWDPFNTGKWSISANYRISYDRVWLATALFVDNTQEGMFTSRTLNGQAGQRLSALQSLFSSKTGYFDPGPILGPKAFDRVGTLTVYDPSFYVPYTGSWSLRIQREIMKHTALAVSYVGNKATGLPRGPNLNQIEIRSNGFLTGFLAAQRNLTAGGDPLKGESTGVFGQIFSVMSAADQSGQRTNITTGAVATVANFIDQTRVSSNYLQRAGLPLNFFRINPQFSTVAVLGNTSNSTWHGMKVELTRRFQQGLQFNANYTFSKGLTDYEGGQSQRDAYRDNKNRNLDKTLQSVDSTHVLNANFIWEIPVGTGRRWMNALHPILNGILGQWQLNGIFNYASGAPFTISSGYNKLTLDDVSTADCSGCDAGMTSKVIRGDTLRALTSEEIKLFTQPSAGSAGLTAQRSFRGSDFLITDSSVFKSFRLRFIPGEQGELQLRFEFFNTFNHVNFSSPSSAITSGTFGTISNAGGGRIIQVALKVLF